jgi:hypothetical protein
MDKLLWLGICLFCAQGAWADDEVAGASPLAGSSFSQLAAPLSEHGWGREHDLFGRGDNDRERAAERAFFHTDSDARHEYEHEHEREHRDHAGEHAQPVPEANSLMLMAMGLALLAWAPRRRSTGQPARHR